MNNLKNFIKIFFLVLILPTKIFASENLEELKLTFAKARSGVLHQIPGTSKSELVDLPHAVFFEVEHDNLGLQGKLISFLDQSDVIVRQLPESLVGNHYISAKQINTFFQVIADKIQNEHRLIISKSMLDKVINQIQEHSITDALPDNLKIIDL